MLLRLGRKETTDPLLADGEDIGCHVIAPVRFPFSMRITRITHN